MRLHFLRSKIGGVRFNGGIRTTALLLMWSVNIASAQNEHWLDLTRSIDVYPLPDQWSVDVNTTLIEKFYEMRRTRLNGKWDSIKRLQTSHTEEFNKFIASVPEPKREQARNAYQAKLREIEVVSSGFEKRVKETYMLQVEATRASFMRRAEVPPEVSRNPASLGTVISILKRAVGIAEPFNESQQDYAAFVQAQADYDEAAFAMFTNETLNGRRVTQDDLRVKAEAVEVKLRATRESVGKLTKETYKFTFGGGQADMVKLKAKLEGLSLPTAPQTPDFLSPSLPERPSEGTLVISDQRTYIFKSGEWWKKSNKRWMRAQPQDSLTPDAAPDALERVLEAQSEMLQRERAEHTRLTEEIRGVIEATEFDSELTERLIRQAQMLDDKLAGVEGALNFKTRIRFVLVSWKAQGRIAKIKEAQDTELLQTAIETFKRSELAEDEKSKIWDEVYKVPHNPPLPPARYAEAREAAKVAGQMRDTKMQALTSIAKTIVTSEARGRTLESNVLAAASQLLNSYVEKIKGQMQQQFQEYVKVRDKQLSDRRVKIEEGFAGLQKIVDGQKKYFDRIDSWVKGIEAWSHYGNAWGLPPEPVQDRIKDLLKRAQERKEEKSFWDRVSEVLGFLSESAAPAASSESDKSPTQQPVPAAESPVKTATTPTPATTPPPATPRRTPPTPTPPNSSPSITPKPAVPSLPSEEIRAPASEGPPASTLPQPPVEALPPTIGPR